MRFIVVFCALLALLPMKILAQETLINISVLVTGSENEPIQGAVVSNNIDDSVIITDDAGQFSLEVPEKTVIKITAVGYKDIEVIVGPNLRMISLEDDFDLVNLPFRQVRKQDLMAAVAVVDAKSLFQHNYTSSVFDGLEAEVGGFNGSSIWGMDGYLVVVDGIPRDISSFRTSEIDQITVLKGASAVALYGTHAANGVLYVTTKRGIEAQQKIDVRVNSGMYVSKSYPDFIGSLDYMELYNEARLNDGSSFLYDESQIDPYRSNPNPYRYPDIDFYSSDFLKKAYNRSDVTAEIYGGDKNARYYTNIGFMREGSFLDFGQGSKAYNQRFNLRGNVDMDFNSWLTGYVDAGIVLKNNRGTHNNFFEEASTIRPNRFSPLLPIDMIDFGDSEQGIENKIIIDNATNIIDGRYVLGGTQQDMSNPIADIYSKGYNTGVDRMFMFNGGLDADLSGILKGLAFRTKVGIDYNTSYEQGYEHQYRIYVPTWDNLDGVDYVKLIDTEDMDQRSTSQYTRSGWYQQMMYFSGQFDYKRNFDSGHNLFAMLIANGYQYSESGVYHKNTNTNLGLFLGYNYLNKYYLDFNGSVLHSTKLPPSNRVSYSPVVTLGWRISNEEFMDGVDFVDNLKLTATAGKIYYDTGITTGGDDPKTHYLYSSYYRYKDTNWFAWAASTGTDVAAVYRGDNYDLKTPYREELSFGIEATLFNRFLDIEANYFDMIYGDGVIQASTLYPSFFRTSSPESSFLPYINYDKEKRSGFDFNVRIKPVTGQVQWVLGLAGTYYDTEILKRSDIYAFDYQEREGTAVDAIWGLQNLGFYADDADIAASPFQTFGEVRPGDIKYVDMNKDGEITREDEVVLGRSGSFGAPLTLGVNLSAKWKNLTLYVQGVGRYGAEGIRNRRTDWIYADRKYSNVVYDRWAYYTHPVSGEIIDTRASATYPRLTTGSGDNNFRNSDFWIYKKDRFDIGKVQLTFAMPQRILGNSFLENLDIYVGAYNLLTISPEKDYLELNVGSAPQTRFFNLGVAASF